MAYPPNMTTSYFVAFTYENPTIGGVTPVTLGLNHSVRNIVHKIIIINNYLVNQ